ncbi:ABC transporter permease [Paenibacillus cellulosilyticus]|nr:ABC transporter permease [Paenibacillus cellulosilyticus]
MTFRHIVNKNLRYNFRRFISYVFVNSFVVAVLFMYGSLLFNEILAQDDAMKIASDYIAIAAYAIILFSIVFVSYTGVYFVKSRGKEFGVYLTLGMTTRDLIRMIVFESLVIVTGSVLCGIAAGLLLSKLFYLLLGRVLNLSTDIYFISYKTFVLSLGVFLFVFLCNLLFTSVFIRRLSIVQITKAATTKGQSKSRPVLGGISTVVFIVSMWLFYAGITGDKFVNNLLGQNKSALLPLVVIVILVSLYFAIASCIDAVRAVCSRFPAFYNRHILILSSLSHRFFTYKVSLYMVSMLIALSLFFMGFGLSLYSYTKKTISEFEPYDYMIETTGSINAISPDEVKQVIEANGGTVGAFSELEYIWSESYRDIAGGSFTHDYKGSLIVSESNYNKHMGTSIDVAPDELLIVQNMKGDEAAAIDYDTTITVEPWREGDARAQAFSRHPMNKDRFVQSVGGGTPILQYEQAKTSSMYAAFINSYGDVEFASVIANVIDDSVYSKLEDQIHNTAYLFNLASGDGDQIYAALLDTLRKVNHADNSLWASAESKFGTPKDTAEFLRPIYKAERYEIAMRISGFMLFSFAFLGVLFLLASLVVLYYKLMTDMDEEKERMILLKKIGLTMAECKSYLQSHLAILFFAPMLIGGIPALILLHASVGFTVYAGYLMLQVLGLYVLFVVMNGLLYVSLRKKFFRGVGLLSE